MSLTVAVATRNRPHLLVQTIQKTLPNVMLPDTRIVILADQDDMETVSLLQTMPHHPQVLVSCLPREDSRGAKYDRVLRVAPADVYLPAVDYAPILTPGFDQAIIRASNIWPDGIGVVYAPMVDELVPYLQAPTAKFVEKMGYIYNHDYPFWFIDHEMADIAWMIGRINFANIKIDASQRPKSTLRMRDLEFWTAYFDMMALERRKKAQSIIMSPDFEVADWQKIQMCNWYQLVEMRSVARNSRVRQWAKQTEQARGDGSPPDEGYLRAKARAETKVQQLLAAIKQAA